MPHDDLSIRAAQDADYAMFERLFPELVTGEATMTRDRFVRDLVPQMIVAERGGEALGYLFYQLLDGIGYVRHLVTSPFARRAGVGRALMTRAAERFRAHGASRWCLNVRPENEAAVSLYEGLGMKRQHASTAVRMAWSRVRALPDIEPRVVVSPIAPERDREIEATMHLLPGVLADGRRRDRHVVVAEDGAAVVGVAVFDPTFPGAHPFHVARPSVARPLLTALEAHRGTHDEIHLLVENDMALAELLLDAGAIKKIDIVSYEGPLPPRNAQPPDVG